jgi:DNA invertase Pin-like site-specific DNA recombinase
MGLRAALYVRVSTEDQHLDHQEHDLRREAERRGWQVVAVFAEKVSGKRAAKRPELEKLRHAAAMNRFQAVLVWSIDRLGRSLLEVLSVVEDLHEHEVGLASLRESAIDTTSSMGRLVLGIFGAVAEFERRRLSERTISGLAGARRRGKTLGRPSKLDPGQVAYAVELHNKRHGMGGVAAAARAFKVDRRTVTRILARHVGQKGGSETGPLFASGSGA